MSFKVNPEEIRNVIKPVKKYSVTRTAAGQVDLMDLTMDAVWIPSAMELGIDRGCESNGVSYTKVLGSRDRRIRKMTGDIPAWWWLRTTASNREFLTVTESGGTYARESFRQGGVLIGFCI